MRALVRLTIRSVLTGYRTIDVRDRPANRGISAAENPALAQARVRKETDFREWTTRGSRVKSNSDIRTIPVR